MHFNTTPQRQMTVSVNQLLSDVLSTKIEHYKLHQQSFLLFSSIAEQLH